MKKEVLIVAGLVFIVLLIGLYGCNYPISGMFLYENLEEKFIQVDSYIITDRSFQLELEENETLIGLTVYGNFSGDSFEIYLEDDSGKEYIVYAFPEELEQSLIGYHIAKDVISNAIEKKEQEAGKIVIERIKKAKPVVEKEKIDDREKVEEEEINELGEEEESKQEKETSEKPEKTEQQLDEKETEKTEETEEGKETVEEPQVEKEDKNVEKVSESKEETTKEEGTEEKQVEDASIVEEGTKEENEEKEEAKTVNATKDTFEINESRKEIRINETKSAVVIKKEENISEEMEERREEIEKVEEIEKINETAVNATKDKELPKKNAIVLDGECVETCALNIRGKKKLKVVVKVDGKLWLERINYYIKKSKEKLPSVSLKFKGISEKDVAKVELDGKEVSYGDEHEINKGTHTIEFSLNMKRLKKIKFDFKVDSDLKRLGVVKEKDKGIFFEFEAETSNINVLLDSNSNVYFCSECDDDLIFVGKGEISVKPDFEPFWLLFKNESKTNTSEVNVSYQKLKDDPLFDVIVNSTEILNGTLIVRFYHTYDKVLPIKIVGNVKYELSKSKAEGNKVVLLKVFDWKGRFFSIIVGKHTEILKFGVPKKVKFNPRASGVSLKRVKVLNKLTGFSVEELQSDSVTEGLYDVELLFEDKKIKSLRINDLYLGEELSDLCDIQLVKDNLFVIEPKIDEPMEFKVVASGDRLYKCADWDSKNNVCLGKWIFLKKVFPGKEYSILINGSDPAFIEKNETTFSGNFYHTRWNGSGIVLDWSDSGNTSYYSDGTYASEVKDAGRIVNWTILEWSEGLRYSDELTSSEVPDCEYLVHMNEQSWSGSDYDVKDSCGAGNINFTSRNGANTSADGRFGRGGSFDGIDDYVYLDDPSTSSNAVFDNDFTDRTIELWFKADSVSGTHFLFEEGGSTNGMCIYIYNGYVYGGAWVESNGWDGNWFSASIDAGEWYHVALVFDGNDELRFYVNGELVGSTSISVTMNSHSGDDSIGCMVDSSKMHTGDVSGGPTYYFDGYIDEFVVHNSVLSASTIKEHYLRGALDLKFQVRSCDNSACSGEDFVGPDGSSSSYYLNSPSSLNVSPNRYFQYKAYFSTENVNYTPILYNATVNYNITPTPPDVSLVSPDDKTQFFFTNDITLTVTATDLDDGLGNCTLWSDIGGSWQAVETKQFSGTSDTKSWDLSNVDKGWYHWNARCCDVDGACGFASSNKTFKVLYPVNESSSSGTFISLASRKYSFLNGSFDNTTFDDDYDAVVTDSFLGNSGIYLSPIININDEEVNWTYISWKTNAELNLSDIVLELHLDEGSGTTAYDSSGNGNNATLINGVGWIDGFRDYGVNCSASDHMLQVSPISLGSSWTLSAWVLFPLPTTTGGWRTLFQQGGGHHHVLVDSSGLLGVYVSGFYSCGFDVDVLSAGWHHLVAIGSGGTTKFYIDGKYKCQSSAQETNDLVYIGNYVGGGQNFGEFDEVMAFSRALSASEVKQLYVYTASELKFKVRSCDDLACSGESFSSFIAQPSSLNLPKNRYFQYASYIWQYADAENSTLRLFNVSLNITVPPSCSNGIKDQDESDIDCGGICGANCADGKQCNSNDDCASGHCEAGICVSCNDGIKNNNETDVDCGGPYCAGCADGKTCLQNSDCQSNSCELQTVYDIDFRDDFDDGNADGWAVVDQGTTSAPSNWYVDSGHYVQDSNIYSGDLATDAPGTYSFWNSSDAFEWNNYVFEVDMMSLDDDSLGVMFRYLDNESYYRFRMNMGDGGSFVKLEKFVNGTRTELGNSSLFSPILGEWYHYRIIVNGSNIKCYINNTLYFDVNDTDLSKGTIALYSWGNNGSYFDNVSVTWSYERGTCVSCNDGIQNQGEDWIDCGGPCPPCAFIPYLEDDCGNASNEPHLMQGTDFEFGSGVNSSIDKRYRTVSYHPDAVILRYNVSPLYDYQFKVWFLQPTGEGRIVDVYIDNDTVDDDYSVPEYNPEVRTYDVPASAISDGVVELKIQRIGGANAVCSYVELWRTPSEISIVNYTWDFSNANDYIFNASLIELVNGTARLKRSHGKIVEENFTEGMFENTSKESSLTLALNHAADPIYAGVQTATESVDKWDLTFVNGSIAGWSNDHFFSANLDEVRRFNSSFGHEGDNTGMVGVYTGLEFDPYLSGNGTAVFWSQYWTYDNLIRKWLVTDEGNNWVYTGFNFTAVSAIGICVDENYIYANTRNLPSLMHTSVYRYLKNGSPAGTLDMDYLECGSTSDCFYGEGITKIGDYLYVGDENGDTVHVVDVSNWSSPQLLNSWSFASQTTNINQLAHKGRRIYLANGGTSVWTSDIVNSVSGNYISKTYDLGTNVKFGKISIDANTPPGTFIGVQIATNNDNASWNFVGPDGTNSSYYADGDDIATEHDGKRFLRFKVFMNSSDNTTRPRVNEIEINYTTVSDYAEIQTKDLEPDILIGWLSFNASDETFYNASYDWASSSHGATAYADNMPGQLIDDIESSTNFAYCTWPCNMTVELSKLIYVDKIYFRLWDYDGRWYNYSLYISTDGSNWTRLVNNKHAQSVQWYNFSSFTPLRYVRVEGLENTANSGFHIIEFAVYGSDSYVEYAYSVDSGNNWISIEKNTDLSDANTSSGKIRFKARILGEGASVDKMVIYFRGALVEQPAEEEVSEERGAGGAGAEAAVGVSEKHVAAVEEEREEKKRYELGPASEVGTFSLAEGEIGDFVFEGSTYSIELMKLTLTYAKLTLNDKEYKLFVGDEAKVDLNGDGEIDVSLRLKAVKNGNAIFELTVVEKAGRKEVIPGVPAVMERKGLVELFKAFYNLLKENIALLLVIIVILLVAGGYYTLYTRTVTGIKRRFERFSLKSIALEGKLLQYKNLVASLEKNISALEEQKAKVEKQLQKLNEEMSKLEKEHANLAAKAEKLKFELSAAKRELAERQKVLTEIKSFEDKQRRLREKYGLKHVDKELLKRKSDLKAAIVSRRRKIKLKEQALERCKRQMEEIDAKKKMLLGLLNEAETELKMREREIASLLKRKIRFAKLYKSLQLEFEKTKRRAELYKEEFL